MAVVVDQAVIYDRPQQTKFDSSAWKRTLSDDLYWALAAYESLVEKHLENLQNKRVGLYGAFINGPLLTDLHHLQIQNHNTDVLEVLKNEWPPRQHFRQTAPMKLAHLSLIYKFKGPIFCATDVNTAARDAVTVAELDLESDVVDYAIVISSFTKENAQVYKKFERHHKSLSECGVCFLLKPNKTFDLDEKIKEPFPATEQRLGSCTDFLRIMKHV